jgi:hypothetical protein
MVKSKTDKGFGESSIKDAKSQKKRKTKKTKTTKKGCKIPKIFIS